MVNQNIFKEKWLYPQTEPDQQNRTRKLGIEPNDFNGDVEGMKFNYSFAKGEGLYFSAPLTVCRDIVDTLIATLSKPEKSVIKFTNENGNKPPVSIHVGRDENLVPFMAISGEIQGAGARQKKFYFSYPKGFRVFRNGEQVSDLELAERACRAFTKNFDLFVRDLEEKYKPREFNNTGGGNFGRGGYNGGGGNGGGNRGGNNGGGYQQQQQSQPPATDSSYDDFV
ncbi:hypothetical protein G173_gp211 [Erwinia phage phiEaH2]|uniref:Uncharacterized protein n=1 Tax=Erwinia phage phiEaH2 TaxID=1029988 RepID=J7KCG7_9CAUD|nr:hypothetical protein G173_gp211 [Erwinia phage phiEaH2]AFQ96756.1 hypothetical protein [Erwinia phage phiEaH2]